MSCTTATDYTESATTLASLVGLVNQWTNENPRQSTPESGWKPHLNIWHRDGDTGKSYSGKQHVPLNQVCQYTYEITLKQFTPDQQKAKRIVTIPQTEKQISRYPTLLNYLALAENPKVHIRTLSENGQTGQQNQRFNPYNKSSPAQHGKQTFFGRRY